MANVTIHDLMFRNHCLLGKFLKELEQDVNIKTFNHFKWELEKHFFMEEKAIFSFDIKEQETSAMLADVMEEHIQILDMLKEIEAKLLKKEDIDLSKLKEFHTKHKNFEDQTLYPKLDEVLSDEQKEQIIERVKALYPGLC
tara:strand:- start:5592 stop:6014 length:423 start_codon:yes stop_codon:yes gene_type:complete